MVTNSKDAIPHYPSWGSETSVNGEIVESKRISLPLMGIGNKLAAMDVGAVQPLITPHGDRKPTRAPACGVSPWSSLPLMGIGNLPSKNILSGNAHSLPLMGIGNTMRPGATSTATTTHYPSWGSETARLRLLKCRPTYSHYPSWGSETCSPFS